jgi:hypothetical protein
VFANPAAVVMFTQLLNNHDPFTPVPVVGISIVGAAVSLPQFLNMESAFTSAPILSVPGTDVILLQPSNMLLAT